MFSRLDWVLAIVGVLALLFFLRTSGVLRLRRRPARRKPDEQA